MSKYKCSVWIPLTKCQYDCEINTRKLVDSLLGDNWYMWKKCEKSYNRLGVRVILIID